MSVDDGGRRWRSVGSRRQGGCRERVTRRSRSLRSGATRLTTPRAATGPLARVRPTTRVRLPGLIVGGIAEFALPMRCGFSAFQDGEIGGWIAARESRGDDAAVGERDVNFFIATQSVLRCDDDAGPPDDTARGSARFGVHRDDICRGAIGGLRPEHLRVRSS